MHADVDPRCAPDRPVHLVAAIGPNPASISEAVWALSSYRRQRVAEMHLVTLEHSSHCLGRELLGPHGILADLYRLLYVDGAVPHMIEHLVRRDDGSAVRDDARPEDAAAYRAATWRAARACVQGAGDRPVVFLLAGGRLRTTTAYMTTTYQLLARGGDRLVDVRVSDRRVEGGVGFYYPEQSYRHIHTRDGVVDARTVDVQLVDVEVPRLAGLIAADHLASFEAALAASQQAIEAMAPPRLEIDLAAGAVRVNGAPVPLTAGQVAWYGALALARVHGAGTPAGTIPTTRCAAAVRALLLPYASARWMGDIRDFALRDTLGLPMIHSERLYEDSPDELLPKLRADTRSAVRRWVESQVRPAWAPWLVPEVKKRAGEAYQRIALDPAQIRIRGPGDEPAT